MKGKKQRSFSSEFKIEVVKEYLETDRSYRELGRKYGLSSSSICNWVK
ncbi:transposase, partial [Mesotoga sp. H07pep.5.4]